MKKKPNYQLQPKKKATKPQRRILTVKRRLWCEKFVELGENGTQASLAVGYPANYASTLLKEPEVLEFIAIIKERMAIEAAKRIEKKRRLNEEFLDENLAQVIEHGGGHERRGEADRVAAIALAYKKERYLPEPAKSGVFAQINNNGPSIPPPIYRSPKVEQLRAQYLPAPVTEPNELATGN